MSLSAPGWILRWPFRSDRPTLPPAARSPDRALQRTGSRPAPLALAVAGLLLLPATSVRADPLAETRAALARYPGTSALEASIAVAVRTGETDDAGLRSGEVTLHAEDSEHGLRVHHPPELLARLRAEAAVSPEEGADLPASEVLSELGASRLDASLDFAGPLRDLLDGADLLEARPAADGEPARLELRADPSRAERPPYVKESELRVTLWLAEDGVPTRVVTDSRVRAGRFFIDVTNHQRTERELARVGDRLVVAESRARLEVAGLGQSFTRSVDVRVEWNAPAGAPAEGAVSRLRALWSPRLVSADDREELAAKAGTALPPTRRDREAFQALAGPITPLQAFRSVGPPDAEVGSGVRILLYALADGAHVELWSPTLDAPARITLYEADGTRRVLLEPPPR